MFGSSNFGWLIEDDRYYTPDEVATAVKAEKRTILRWTAPGPRRRVVLRHWRMGKVVLIRGLWLKVFFDAQRGDEGDDPGSRN